MLTEKTRITSEKDFSRIIDLPAYEEIHQKLYKYEENIEKGKILLPPCAIGDIVYTSSPEGIILGKIVSFQVNVTSKKIEYFPRVAFYLKSPFSLKYEYFELECVFEKDNSRKTIVFTSYEDAVMHFQRSLNFDAFRHQFCLHCTSRICMYDHCSNIACARKQRKEEKVIIE